MKEKIKKWFEQGLWTLEKVRNAVVKGVINESDCKEIVGYVETFIVEAEV